MGALDNESISDFLKKYNKDEASLEKAKENFLK